MWNCGVEVFLFLFEWLIVDEKNVVLLSLFCMLLLTLTVENDIVKIFEFIGILGGFV